MCRVEHPTTGGDGEVWEAFAKGAVARHVLRTAVFQPMHPKIAADSRIDSSLRGLMPGTESATKR